MKSQSIERSNHDSFLDRLGAARRSDSRLGDLLQSCRDYLLLVANSELPADVRQKVAPSDLVQETFVEAREAFPAFPGEAPDEFRAWLRRILLNNASDTIRRFRVVKKRQIGRELQLDAALGGDQTPHGLASVEKSPSRQARAHEESECVLRALAQLSDEHRRIVELRNLEQLTFVEIGRLTNRTPSAARMLWVRAIRNLSAAMGPEHDSRSSL